MKPEDSGTPTIPPLLREYMDLSQPEERTDLQQVWALLEEARPDDNTHAEATDAAWARLQRHQTAQPVPPPRRATGRIPVARHARRLSFSRAWIAVAALVVVGLVGGLYWTTPVTHTALADSRLTATLPDGSTVELNAGSTLTHRRGYGALPFAQPTRRTVTLDGEAFFDVKKAEIPFTIETVNTRIDVLGTTFNVEAWHNDGETTVTLASGRVQVTGTGVPDEPVVLSEAGQFVKVKADAQPPTQPQATRLNHTLAWRTGDFAVYHQPIAEIFKRLERHFNVSITTRDVALDRDSLILFYSQPLDVEAIISDICTHKGLKYRATSRGYEVFQD